MLGPSCQLNVLYNLPDAGRCHNCLPPWQAVESGEGWHERKVKFVPFYLMGTYTGSRGVTPRILNLAIRGGCGQIHAPTYLPPVKHRGTHWSWLGLSSIVGQEGCGGGDPFLSPPGFEHQGLPVRSWPYITKAQLWRVAASVQDKKSRTDIKGWSSTILTVKT